MMNRGSSKKQGPKPPVSSQGRYDEGMGFEHIVLNVLMLSSGSPILKAFRQQDITSLNDFMDLRDDGIEKLYNVVNRRRAPLSIGHCSLLKIFHDYVRSHATVLRKDPAFPWFLTPEKFSDFRIEQWESRPAPISSGVPAITSTTTDEETRIPAPIGNRSPAPRQSPKLPQQSS